MSLKLDQLQHLVAIVEHGSLRSAARRLGLPRPALTRSVRGLERDLGCELFTRAAQGMTLTARGASSTNAPAPSSTNCAAHAGS